MSRLLTVRSEAARRLQTLIRTLSVPGLERAVRDVKCKEEALRIYIPHDVKKQYDYYQQVAEDHPEIGIDVRYLPVGSDTHVARYLRRMPGILALDMEETKQGLRPRAYIVPGGRFNEMYRWDTVFAGCAIHDPGLLEDLIYHFIFMIKHYGGVLNANRTYYLNRLQPPMLTALLVHYLDVVKQWNKSLVERAIGAIAIEYETVWMSGPRYDEQSGLSRYQPNNTGIPTECEPGHFDESLKSHANRHGVTVDVLIENYNNGTICDAEVDEFVLNDAAMRESGRDTTSRFGDRPRWLLPVCLNSHLYKLETDLATIIKKFFGGQCTNDGRVDRSDDWEQRAELRRQRMNQHLLCAKDGIFYDYDIERRELHRTISSSNILPMYAGLADQRHADAIVEVVMPQLLRDGGLMTTAVDCKEVRTHKQWDAPCGWAPDQVIACLALAKYGYNRMCIILGVSWLRRICDVFDMTGLFYEKYDVVDLRSGDTITSEYGNQTDFGWTMASVLVIIDLISNLKLADRKELGESNDGEQGAFEEICTAYGILTI